MGQMRLPWPRGQKEITCGHPEKRHYSGGMCVACYHRDYRRQLKAYRTAKEATAVTGSEAWIRDQLPGETYSQFQDRMARGVAAND